MVPRNHSAGLAFIFHLKHHHVANIDIDGRGGEVRNSSPGLYHVNPGLPEKTDLHICTEIHSFCSI